MFVYHATERTVGIPISPRRKKRAGMNNSLTRARLMAVQASLKLPATGVADARTWAALEARDYPLRAYWGTTLRRGSSGPAVVALQKALRIPADGHFGVQTEGAVKAAQRTARLTQTGVVALLTWQAIEKAMIR